MSDEPRPKIIVDDDWKSKVQAEKEQARQQQDRASGGEPPSASDRPDETGPESEEIPPASFVMLVGTLATQALVALGQTPLPGQGKPTVNLEHAKHFIDTLGVLEDKTRGNLDPQESAMLTNILDELRMAYVAISSRK